ncbi:hypothetical protein RRG08_012561 [Elysia crispata]|uniref:Uncharacterized protein n=1 Tax=Elysia crispata TaxID=231223 RepID=A0AAE1AP36_9GAST|nr:hypothetical protein RRG08_012561 [Elysia crispata]
MKSSTRSETDLPVAPRFVVLGALMRDLAVLTPALFDTRSLYWPDPNSINKYWVHSFISRIPDWYLVIIEKFYQSENRFAAELGKLMIERKLRECIQIEINVSCTISQPSSWFLTIHF